MAWQMYEESYAEDEMVIVGIKEAGLHIAKLLSDELERIGGEMTITLIGVSVNKQAPFASEIQFDQELDIKSKSVILVDDVLNTGKTLIAASIPLLQSSPARLKTAILANRDHKQYPIAADYVGISLATTLEEHITFSISENGEMSVQLD
jgi:pyrimidine operon attenuation protein/uracil phosphoribosyltransferase